MLSGFSTKGDYDYSYRQAQNGRQTRQCCAWPTQAWRRCGHLASQAISSPQWLFLVLVVSVQLSPWIPMGE